MSDFGAEATRADKIDVERERGLTVTFGDGHECFFSNEELRTGCPCASCRDLRSVDKEVWSGGTISILNAELVGHWGISFAWSDGHGTGIFPFDSLREWCEVNREGS
jgi:DUF971 family protein